MPLEGGSKWEREVPTIVEFIKANLSIREISEHYGIEMEYMRQVLKRLRKRGALPTREAIMGITQKSLPEKNQQVLTIDYPDKKVPNFNYRDFLNTAIELQRQKAEKEISQSEATIRITTDKPFAISFSSDWHIGSCGTNYEALLSHIDLWLRVPNLFVGLLGDHVDNFVTAKIKSGMLSALFSPQDQHDVAKEIFREIGSKIIFQEAGNHEGFSYGEAGFDIAQSFYEGAVNAPYLREGGGVNIVVNDLITYRIYAKHKYRFYSNLNPTNSNKRMHDLESPFDIGIIGHYHNPTIEHTQRWSGVPGKEVIYIITGTYKTDDKWAKSEGFGAKSYVGSPTVIFYPFEKRMVPFRDLETAIKILEALNK